MAQLGSPRLFFCDPCTLDNGFFFPPEVFSFAPSLKFSALLQISAWNSFGESLRLPSHPQAFANDFSFLPPSLQVPRGKTNVTPPHESDGYPILFDRLFLKVPPCFSLCPHFSPLAHLGPWMIGFAVEAPLLSVTAFLSFRPHTKNSRALFSL